MPIENFESFPAGFYEDKTRIVHRVFLEEVHIVRYSIEISHLVLVDL